MENTDLYIDEKGTLAAPLVDADAGKRFLNLLIDIGVVIFLIVIFNKILYHHSIFSYLGMFKVLDIAVVFAYFYGLENSLGQTVGKMITKTKVVIFLTNKAIRGNHKKKPLLPIRMDEGA